jgi:hypothetical protein
MACAGAGFVFIHSGLGFIWRPVRESTFPIHLYSSADGTNCESFFFTRTSGFANRDANS